MMIDCLYYLGLIHVITFIMQAFPGFEDIGLTLFSGGVLYPGRLHGFLYNNFDSNLIVLLQKS